MGDEIALVVHIEGTENWAANRIARLREVGKLEKTEGRMRSNPNAGERGMKRRRGR